MQPADFHAHLHAHLCVQVRQGLVEQEDFRLAHDRAADRDALALPAGQRLGPAFQQLPDPEDLRRFVDAFLDDRLTELSELQAEGHVVEHRHVGIQSVVLEHHRDVAVLRRNVVHHAVPDGDRPGADLLESSHHAESGGLAASGRSHEHDKFLVRDGEVEILHGHDIAGIGLANVLQFHIGHDIHSFQNARDQGKEIIFLTPRTGKRVRCTRVRLASAASRVSGRAVRRCRVCQGTLKAPRSQTWRSLLPRRCCFPAGWVARGSVHATVRTPPRN